MRQKVGWFVMLGLGAIVALLLVATLRTDVFARKFTLYVAPPSASAFFVGQEVKFQGFTIGRVDDIELQPRGEVSIALSLLDRYRGMLHQGSTAQLVKPGLLGQEHVELTSGDIQTAMLADGAHVPFREQATLEQLLMDMKPAVANADSLLAELAQLAHWLNDPKGDVRLATANIRAATQNVDQGAVQQAVSRISAAAAQFERLSQQLADNKAGEHLALSLEKAAQVLKNIEPLTSELKRQAPEALTQSRALVERLDELSRSLSGSAADLQQMTPELPGLAQESRKAMLEMQRLAGSVRNTWLGGGSGEPVQTGSELVAPPAMDAP
jgi:phospholipid/cholesterol/gamma-HCH transport system substrate-binding protein